MGRTLRLLAGTGFAAALALCAVAARPTPAPGPTTPQGAEAQWNIRSVGAPAAWPHSTGRGITIAIVDSGIDLVHPDLADRIRADTACLGTGGDPAGCGGSGDDTSGHGTHVAGIAAAHGPGRDGVRGVAPGADLLAVRVVAGSCPVRSCVARGSAADVAAGVRWAAGHGADVVNLSLEGVGSGLDDPQVAEAIRAAWRAGVVVVAAAGNFQSPVGLRDLPVVVVVASDRDGAPTSYDRGAGGARWALTAPGGTTGDTDATCTTGGSPQGVLSTYDGLGRSYACLAGTSMAAPHVSGAIALLLSEGYSPREAIDRLRATATDIGLTGTDGDTGSGLLDVGRATDPDAGRAATVARAEAPAGTGGRMLPTLLAGAAVAVAVATIGLWLSRERSSRRPAPLEG